MKMLNTGHLFAGAGGGLLGDLILGHKPVFAVEWDKNCCTTLRHRADDLVPGAVKALGNGQVPLQAAVAYVLLGGPIGE